MKDTRWNDATTLLDHAIAANEIPGAVAAAGRHEEVLWRYVGGMAVVHGGLPRKMTGETFFDMASLTKVMVTLPSVLILASRGQIVLSEPVSRYLPHLVHSRWDAVTVQHLLTHTAGLAPDRPYWRTLQGKDAFLSAIYEEPWENEPGSTVSYSDLGYILLGAVVEAVSLQSLGPFAHENVFTPLAMTNALYNPSSDLRDDAAATEIEAGAALLGMVHDENARAMGGMAGHAGLFATLDSVIRYVMSWTGSGSMILADSIRQRATAVHTGGLNGKRGLGWALPGDGFDVGGDFWPVTGAGHTGFTGTSIQFDPVSGAWAVLLTNRVHYGRGKNINPLRRALHNVVMANALS